MPARPPGYWKDFATLAGELLAFDAEQGVPGVMPTLAELMAAGRFDLSYAVPRHGGLCAARERLGW